MPLVRGPANYRHGRAGCPPFTRRRASWWLTTSGWFNAPVQPAQRTGEMATPSCRKRRAPVVVGTRTSASLPEMCDSHSGRRRPGATDARTRQRTDTRHPQCPPRAAFTWQRVRSWAAAHGRSIARTFKCFDHKETPHNLGGLVTITGGKATTLRAMAEKTADVVCARLGISAPCVTKEVAPALLSPVLHPVQLLGKTPCPNNGQLLCASIARRQMKHRAMIRLPCKSTRMSMSWMLSSACMGISRHAVCASVMPVTTRLAALVAWSQRRGKTDLYHPAALGHSKRGCVDHRTAAKLPHRQRPGRRYGRPVPQMERVQARAILPVTKPKSNILLLPGSQKTLTFALE